MSAPTPNKPTHETTFDRICKARAAGEFNPEVMEYKENNLPFTDKPLVVIEDVYMHFGAETELHLLPCEEQPFNIEYLNSLKSAQNLCHCDICESDSYRGRGVEYPVLKFPEDCLIHAEPYQLVDAIRREKQNLVKCDIITDGHFIVFIPTTEEEKTFYRSHYEYEKAISKWNEYENTLSKFPELKRFI